MRVLPVPVVVAEVVRLKRLPRQPLSLKGNPMETLLGEIALQQSDQQRVKR